MEEIVRDYYTQALQRALAEEVESEEEREFWVNFLHAHEEQMERHPRSFNEQKLKWFEGLAPTVIEFAQNCELNLRMRLTDDCCGSILFETSYLELTAHDDEVIRKFWLYLCQRGRLTISQSEDTFKIEFLFALFDFDKE